MDRTSSFSICLVLLLSQNLLISAFHDQKNYYSPDPGHAGTPPSGGTAPTGHTPSHHHGNPPSHGEGGHTPTPSTPSHGGGGYTPTPSTPSGGNCGVPPSNGTPSTPSNPPSHGGSYYPPPTSGGGYNPPPTSGGGYNPPPTSGGGYNPPPTSGGSPPTPVIGTPPIDPGTPTIPTPPYFPAPFPSTGGTCDFWRNHPGLIWGLLGWWGTVGSAFGAHSVPGFGPNMSLQEALSNTRSDGLGALYREGTASFLNSMVNHRFPFTTKQVRDSFAGALSSSHAAASQAHLFRLANEGRLKPRD